GIRWLLCIACFGHLAGATGVSFDWPRFRGATGDSITSESGWKPRALAPSPKILWRCQVGAGYSGTCIGGPNLYTMGYHADTDTVFCLDVETGREIWRYAYPCAAGSYPGPRATPLFSGGLSHTISRNGQVFCFEAATGKVKWQSDLLKDANAKPPTWGLGTSIVSDGNTLYLNVGQYGLAMDATTGQVLWQSPKERCGYASPVLYDADGERRLICFGQNACYGVQAKTGELLWRYPWPTGQDENTADPVFWREHVFLSSVYGKGSSVIRVTNNIPTEVWLNQQLLNKFATSVLLDGRLYGVHGNTGSGKDGGGMLRCLDFMTGAQLWEHDLGRIGSLLIADGKLVILTETGKLHLAMASPDGYHELAQAAILNTPVDQEKTTKGKFWTPPVLCRGLVFCRNDQGDLICVSLR
ncbi:MAG: PQQ-binding-like beta-propeller repeat protein, partial [Verrucomicrobia bacterium]|nr:PQQ-binding-like beta-propeller repeat protein [Verrucomicrobiota bacterium]